MCESQITMNPFPPNTLVCYQGGGYDGCICELNFAYIGSDGAFHNVLATGAMGCKTLEELSEKWEGHQEELAEWKKDEALNLHGPYPKDFDLYNLDNPDELIHAADELPVGRLLGLAQWFREAEIDVTFQPMCGECGCRFDAAQGTGEEVFCPGGIVLEPGKIVCQECESNYTCAYCGEYAGKRHMAKNVDTGYCVWCRRKHGDKP